MQTRVSYSSQNGVTTTVPPQLARAVSEATNPIGPSFEGPAVYQLDEYLSNPLEAQIVYHALLQRASAEPISPAVVLRSVEVLKRCLPRFEPSEQILESILDFCGVLAQSFATSQPGLQKSVLYLETLAINMLNAKQAAYGRSQHSRGISEPALLKQRGSNSSAGNVNEINLRRTSSLPGASFGIEDTTSVASLPLEGLRRSSGPLASEIKLNAMGRGIKHDVLSWRWAEPDVLMPGLKTPHPSELSRYELSAKEGAHIPQTPIEQIFGVAEAVNVIRQRQRQQALQASQAHESSRPKLRDNRPRLLFQHQPYSEQAALNLNDSDISAVMEGVLDIADGAKIWSERDVLDFRDGPPRSSSQNKQAHQICANILIKLLLDLWSQNKAAVSFPLALMMLSGGLDSTKTSIRSRAFDVIYNAAIHAELLYPAETSTFDLEAQATEEVARKVGDTAFVADLKERASEIALGVASPERDTEPLPEAVSDTNKQRFLQWLRLLLFQLILHIKQNQEDKEEVWNAALNAFLQLTVENGDPSAELLKSIPPCIVSTLLNRSIEFHWSELVHNHLVRMATNALYLDNRNAVTVSNSGQHPALSDSQLEDFGGIHEIMLLFKQAPSDESAQNLLAVLVDYSISLHIKTRVEAEEAILEASRLLGAALRKDGLVRLLQGACLCAWPGFQDSFGAYLRKLTEQPDSAGMQEEEIRIYELTDTVLKTIEEIACESAVAVPPENMLVTVCHTIASARGEKQKHEDELSPTTQGEKLDSEWTQLAGLLSGRNESDARLASSWLLSLLVAIADKEEYEGDQKHGSFNGRVKALFPQLSGSAPSPKCPSGIDSPALACFLHHVLSQPETREGAATRIVLVVKRLLIYLQSKFCTDGFNSTTPGNIGSSGPGILEVPEENSPSCTDIILPVLSLLVEWLYEVAEGSGKEACVEAASILIECVTIPKEHTPVSEDRNGMFASHDWLEERYNDPFVEGEGAESLSLSARTHTPVSAFLSCASICPLNTLRKLSPGFLSRLYHHLGDGTLPSHLSRKGMQSALRARDIRAAVFLLLIARCSLDKTALQQAGGEGLFVDLLADSDPRVRFHAAVFLQQRLRTTRPEVYRRALTHIMQQALVNEDDNLLLSAHLQVNAMLEQKLIYFSV